MELTSEILATAGVPEPERVAAAAAPVAPWLARMPPEGVLDGLARTADPAGALHALERLLAFDTPDLAPLEVAALLRVLGGSPALAQSLIGEGQAWGAAMRDALGEAARDAATHAAALAALGVGGAMSRDELQSCLRRYRRREYVRIGSRDLLEIATVDDTVRELSVLAEAVITGALDATRARVAAEWGGDPPVAFVVMGMGKLGGGELNYSSDVDLVYVYERDGQQGRLSSWWSSCGSSRTYFNPTGLRSRACFLNPQRTQLTRAPQFRLALEFRVRPQVRLQK